MIDWLVAEVANAVAKELEAQGLSEVSVEGRTVSYDGGSFEITPPAEAPIRPRWLNGEWTFEHSSGETFWAMTSSDEPTIVPHPLIKGFLPNLKTVRKKVKALAF